MVSTLRNVRTLYLLQQQSFKKIFNLHIRNLNLLECQSKVLLQNYGVNVQKFVIIEDPQEAEDLESRFKVDEYVVKAQVLASGRGLGIFDNGFEGGIHLTKDPKEVLPICKKMVGHRLVTKQTTKDGILVKKVMVAESVKIKRETYFSIVMDSISNGPVIIASPVGGRKIDTVAKETPELIKKFPVDIFKGISNSMAAGIADYLQFKGELQEKAVNEIKRLYDLFLNVDAVQVEINPLAETDDNQIVSIDARINFDDNAYYRQRAIFQMEDLSDSDPVEVMALKNKFRYFRLSGNVGCLVNGGGLATMDIVKLHGGELANFLDVGGHVTEEKILAAFNIITSDPKVKFILVNIFGGIVNCSTIATGILNVSKSIEIQTPLIIRFEGTDAEKGKKILLGSDLPITFASDLDEAASQAVSVSVK